MARRIPAMGGVIAYAAPGESTSPKWSAAFAQGCGGRVQVGGPFHPGPLAFWGSPLLWSEFLRAKADGRIWYYGDHAFFGRGRYYRCARNSVQFDGRWGDDDPSRFRKFNIPIVGWRKSGSHILVCPNSETFLSLYGFARGQWVAETVAELKRNSDRPIRVRWKTEANTRSLRDALKDCWAVVTFVSNAAVEAILAGVPAICTAPCAGLTMGGADIEKIESPPMPTGREAWAARLANNQWSLDEMRRGDLWRVIGAT